MAQCKVCKGEGGYYKPNPNGPGQIWRYCGTCNSTGTVGGQRPSNGRQCPSCLGEGSIWESAGPGQSLETCSRCGGSGKI
jgi:DnaJ-class molecular chaperone